MEVRGNRESIHVSVEKEDVKMRNNIEGGEEISLGKLLHGLNLKRFE